LQHVDVEKCPKSKQEIIKIWQLAVTSLATTVQNDKSFIVHVYWKFCFRNISRISDVCLL